MKTKLKQSGLTLTEMTVVIATILLLISLGLPAFRALIKSFETEGSTKSMISAALASARTIAAKEQKYAGIRFQNVYDPCNPDPLNASQYMIFIIYDRGIPPSVQGNLGCRAVKGLKPIKLPENMGVMDLVLGANNNVIIDTDAGINDQHREGLVDTTTFSILFSPSGRLVLHTHKVQKATPNDDVFNTKTYISRQGNRGPMFIEDIEQDQPFETFFVSIQPNDELSRNSFIIYDRKEFKKAYERGRAWSEYLRGLEVVYINPYIGTIISPD
jgi:type II secretory pathway pseudopilin PulG